MHIIVWLQGLYRLKMKAEIGYDSSLEKYNIQAIVQNCPLYRYDLFINHGLGNADCPNTDYFFDNMVSFPFYVWMKEEELDYMINSIKKTLEEIS